MKTVWRVPLEMFYCKYSLAVGQNLAVLLSARDKKKSNLILF